MAWRFSCCAVHSDSIKYHGVYHCARDSVFVFWTGPLATATARGGAQRAQQMENRETRDREHTAGAPLTTRPSAAFEVRDSRAPSTAPSHGHLNGRTVGCRPTQSVCPLRRTSAGSSLTRALTTALHIGRARIGGSLRRDGGRRRAVDWPAKPRDLLLIGVHFQKGWIFDFFFFFGDCSAWPNALLLSFCKKSGSCRRELQSCGTSIHALCPAIAGTGYGDCTTYCGTVVPYCTLTELPEVLSAGIRQSAQGTGGANHNLRGDHA